MARQNLDLLRKDELVFFLKLYNLKHDTTATLPTLVNILKENPDSLSCKTDINRFNEAEIQELIAESQIQYQDISTFIAEQLGLVSAPTLRRLRARINYYIQRIEFLLESKFSSKSKDDLQKLSDNYLELLHRLVEPESKQEEFIKASTSTATLTTVHPTLTTTNMCAETTPSLLFQPLRIKHAAQKLLDNAHFVVNDATQALEFLQFFLQFRELTAHSTYTPTEFYILLLNVVEGKINFLVQAAIKQGYDITHFHFTVLEFFFPPRVRTKYLMEHYYAPQKPSEDILAFVQRIKRFALLFQLHESEKDICSLIMSGLNDKTRLRCVFSTIPTTYTELDQLIIEIQHVADNNPQPVLMPSEINLTQNQMQLPLTQVAQSSQVLVPTQTCAFCGKMGHSSQFCFKRRRQFQSNPPL